MRIFAPALCLCLFVEPLPAFGQEKIRLRSGTLDEEAPWATTLAAAALDTKRKRMMVFGAWITRSGYQSRLVSFDLKSEEWEQVKTVGQAPDAGHGPSLVYVRKEDAFYMFGGWRPGSRYPTKELWRLKMGMQRLRWRRISTDNTPYHRNGACMILDAPRNRLLLHGGDKGPYQDKGYVPLDDLWAFDLSEHTWTELKPTGDIPPPRWNHAATTSRNDRLYLFGGAGYTDDGPVAENDVYELALDSLAWRKIEASGRRPYPVQGTSLTYDPKYNMLVVAGGLRLNKKKKSKPASRHVWCLDLDSNAWSRFKSKLPEYRRDHIGIYDPTRRRHLLFGGQTAKEEGNFYRSGRPLSDMISIRLSKPKKKKKED